MTKAELVTEIAIQTGYDKVTIMNVLESAMLNIKKTVAGGDSVFLRSFGTFLPKLRKEKIARNISKNISMVVPEHRVAAFKPSPEFNEELK